MFGKLMSFHSRFLLLPTSCVLCHHPTQETSNMCLPCQQDLPILSQTCQQCAQILPVTQKSALICGTCLQNPPSFNRTYALFPYTDPIIRLIVQLKFNHQLHYARTLGELLVAKIQMDWYRNRAYPDLIVPVPLHPKRLRERGFNQALEIARPIANTLAIPLNPYATKRILYTAAQSGLSAPERKKNMAKAFIAEGDYTGLTIAVIDDVVTTGYTIAEVCRVLKKQGAKHIDVWCCARRDIALAAKTR